MPYAVQNDLEIQTHDDLHRLWYAQGDGMPAQVLSYPAVTLAHAMHWCRLYRAAVAGPAGRQTHHARPLETDQTKRP